MPTTATRFKPAAIDSASNVNNRLILEPETSRSVEGGIKAVSLTAAWTWKPRF